MEIGPEEDSSKIALNCFWFVAELLIVVAFDWWAKWMVVLKRNCCEEDDFGRPTVDEWHSQRDCFSTCDCPFFEPVESYGKWGNKLGVIDTVKYINAHTTWWFLWAYGNWKGMAHSTNNSDGKWLNRILLKFNNNCLFAFDRLLVSRWLLLWSMDRVFFLASAF